MNSFQVVIAPIFMHLCVILRQATRPRRRVGRLAQNGTTLYGDGDDTRPHLRLPAHNSSPDLDACSPTKPASAHRTIAKPRPTLSIRPTNIQAKRPLGLTHLAQLDMPSITRPVPTPASTPTSTPTPTPTTPDPAVRRRGGKRGRDLGDFAHGERSVKKTRALQGSASALPEASIVRQIMTEHFEKARLRATLARTHQRIVRAPHAPQRSPVAAPQSYSQKTFPFQRTIQLPPRTRVHRRASHPAPWLMHVAQLGEWDPDVPSYNLPELFGRSAGPAQSMQSATATRARIKDMPLYRARRTRIGHRLKCATNWAATQRNWRTSFVGYEQWIIGRPV